MVSQNKLLLLCFFLFFWNNAFSKSLTVYIFLSETCPICQSISPEIKKLNMLYTSDNFRFIGVFPDKSQSNEVSRKAFAKKYGLTFELLGDSGRQLTSRFKASITPEVVIIDNENQSIVYRGKVDNSFVSVGKRRTVVTEYYLRTALLHWIEGRQDLIINTEPVGCFIQKQKMQYEK